MKPCENMKTQHFEVLFEHQFMTVKSLYEQTGIKRVFTTVNSVNQLILVKHR